MVFPNNKLLWLSKFPQTCKLWLTTLIIWDVFSISFMGTSLISCTSYRFDIDFDLLISNVIICYSYGSRTRKFD